MGEELRTRAIELLAAVECGQHDGRLIDTMDRREIDYLIAAMLDFWNEAVERAAKFADDAADGAHVLRLAAQDACDREGALVHREAVMTAKEIGAAIRAGQHDR